ncbi:MAG: lamin tail domain-containing protein, partial [Thermoplasmata archaeon]|nr:lamin tail domain-containing protein [Thermoplasmata archaeon]
MIMLAWMLLSSIIPPSYLAGEGQEAMVIINEFLAWPMDGMEGAQEEYIELYNPASETVVMDGWALDDIEGGGAQPFSLKGMSIGPGEYLVLLKSQTGIGLNNDGDSVRLLDQDNEVVDEYQYRFADPGIPFSRLPDGGQWYSPVDQSPGTSNELAPMEPVASVLFSSFLPVCVSRWEYVSLVNNGPSLSLEGWRISDGEGCWHLPAYMLEQGEEGVIASNATCYELETGALPDMVPEKGEIILSDDKEGLFLFDPWGRMADVVWYGDATPEGEGWTSPPVPKPGWGAVVHRRGDTNTSADWPPLYNTMVGATCFEGEEHQVDGLVCFVSPDGGVAPVLDVVNEAVGTLDVNLYELTQQKLIDALVEACERGVAVRMLLEGGPVSWNWTSVPEEEATSAHLEAYIELEAASRIESADGEVRFIAPDGTVGSRNERYRFDHAKYAIADGKRMVLGTENWKPTGLPEEGERGNRGWGLVLRSSSLCTELGVIFQSDWEGVGDVVAFGEGVYVSPPDWFSPEQTSSSRTHVAFPPMVL